MADGFLKNTASPTLADSLRQQVVSLGAVLTQPYEKYTYELRKIEKGLGHQELFEVNIADPALREKVIGFLSFIQQSECIRIERNEKTGEEISRERVFSGPEIFERIQEAQTHRPEALESLAAELEQNGQPEHAATLRALAHAKLEITSSPPMPGHDVTAQVVRLGKTAEGSVAAGMILYPDIMKRTHIASAAPASLTQAFTGHRLELPK